MRWKFVNTPLGQCDTPYTPSRKCNNGAMAAANLASGFMADLINMGNVDATNAANRAIANETNQYNWSIAQANREYDRLVRAQDWSHYLQTDQEAYRRFLENREYESVGSQMQRLRDAGINPYLAMYGGSGHAGSSGGSVPSVGSPPSGHGGETPPFAQTGAPLQAFTNFGQGISQGLANYLSIQASEREDARLQSDLAYTQNKIELEYMEYLSNHQFRGAQAKFWKDQIDQMRHDYNLRRDEYQLKADWQSFQKNAEQYKMAQKDTELAIQQMLAESKVSLDRSQASNFVQLIKESIQRVDSMQHADKLSDKEFYNKVGQDLFYRRFDLARLGIDVERQPFEKFSLLLGSAAQTVGLGLGAYMGLSRGVMNSGIGRAGTVVRGFGKY